MSIAHDVEWPLPRFGGANLNVLILDLLSSLMMRGPGGENLGDVYDAK
jgi:hypothetical protein